MIDPARQSRLFCAEVARRQAGNFYVSFLLLPAERRRAMCALYAFFRRCDDIADDSGAVVNKKNALDEFRANSSRRSNIVNLKAGSVGRRH